MNQQVADIALMYVLPLGITFTAILQAVSADTRYHKLLAVLFSVVIVIMDCIFYFAKNSFITYNCDGGLLLAFGSLFIMGFIHALKCEDLPSKIGHYIFCFFMFSGFLGIAYWDRPTFIPTQDYSPAEISAMNAQYQDYIASFAEGNEGKTVKAQPKHPVAGDPGEQPSATRPLSESALSRLDSYTTEAQSVIVRMRSIAESILNFQKLPANISEPERENRGRQALAISNNAVALNKKVLGLFHPHESSEAHSELIQASESVRLAAYSLYNYAIQENPEDQQTQYSQAMSQVVQMNTHINSFWADIENLKQNYQPQTKEQQDQQ